jgi:hypothetical protein
MQLTWYTPFDNHVQRGASSTAGRNKRVQEEARVDWGRGRELRIV